jgi:hypothetical protein
MTRLPDWRIRLAAYLSAARLREFAYGEHDCAQFAAGAVVAITGVDPAARLGISYATLRGGLRALSMRGYRDHVAFARAELTEIGVADARHGDIAVIAADSERTLGVVGGPVVLAPGLPRGLVAVPLTPKAAGGDILTAFRV